MQNFSQLKKLDGFSLIESLVALGVMSVASLAIISMLNSQQNEVQALSSKLAVVELQGQIRNVIANTDYCGCVFRNKNFDTTNLANPWSSPVLSLPSAYAQPIPAWPANCVEAGGFMVPPVGQMLNGTRLVISGIQMTNILQQGTGLYTGNLEISIDPNSTRRLLKNISLPLAWTVDATAGVPTARPFLNCGLSSPGGTSLSGVFTNVDNYNFALPPGNYQLLLLTTYFTCSDLNINMLLDGLNVATYNGFNGDSEGCDQNTLTTTLAVVGGNHAVTFSGAAPPIITASGNQWTHIWMAFKQ